MDGAKKISCLKTAFSTAIAIAVLAHGESAFAQFFYAGATPNEGAVLARFSRLAEGKDTAGTLEVYKTLLQQSPENRPLRVNRARFLIGLGLMAEASDDIQMLVRNSENFPGVRQAQVEFARVSGKKSEELATYQAWASEKRNQDPMIAMWQPEPLLFEADIAELRGDLKAADDAWQKYFHGDRRSAFYRDYGDFYLRNGRYREAAETYHVLIDNKMMPDDFVGSAYTRQAMAYWASGKKGEAETSATQGFAKLSAWRESHGNVGDLEIATLLAAYIKSPAATLPKEPAGVSPAAEAAAMAIQKWGERIDTSKMYAYDNIVAAKCGKISRSEGAGRIIATLKMAPYVEWALWSACLLGLEEPDQAPVLLKQMPPETVQHRILSQVKA